MLRLFLRKAGYPLSRDEIRAAVWGYSHFISLKDIDKTVALLNDRIASDPMQPPRIAAVGDTGYQFEMP
jgi:DNA-binding response OmpR family regulator